MADPNGDVFSWERRQAIFILGQSKDPKVVPILADIAAKDADLKIAYGF